MRKSMDFTLTTPRNSKKSNSLNNSMELIRED